jgi:hypothetical protein
MVSIGNMLNKYIGCEPMWKTKMDRLWARIQIEVELKYRLVDELEPMWGEYKWMEKVDYWKVPFRCYGYHEVGHVVAHCKHQPFSFPSFQKTWK